MFKTKTSPKCKPDDVTKHVKIGSKGKGMLVKLKGKATRSYLFSREQQLPGLSVKLWLV